jgi:hypothetical protein
MKTVSQVNTLAQKYNADVKAAYADRQTFKALPADSMMHGSIAECKAELAYQSALVEYLVHGDAYNDLYGYDCDEAIEKAGEKAEKALDAAHNLLQGLRKQEEYCEAIKAASGRIKAAAKGIRANVSRLKAEKALQVSPEAEQATIEAVEEAPKYRSFKYNGVCIREGNTKIGAAMNVSLMPGLSCNPEVPCLKLCYDAKLANFRSNIKRSRLQNYEVWRATPDLYFAAIRKALRKVSPTHFRWHVGGDIPNQAYYAEMVQIALEFPAVKFLAMTKSRQLDFTATAPNLTVLASQWADFQWAAEGRGKTDIRFKAEKKTRAIRPQEYLCPADCVKCGRVCWAVKAGTTVVFDQH